MFIIIIIIIIITIIIIILLSLPPTQMMDTAGSATLLVTFYLTIPYHTPESGNVHSHHVKNLKSYIGYLTALVWKQEQEVRCHKETCVAYQKLTWQ
jgi:hypothetical protein